MDLVSLLILIVVVVALVILCVFIIDKTFTGPLAEWAWVAKIVVGIIALILVLGTLADLSGVHLGAVHIGR